MPYKLLFLIFGYHKKYIRLIIIFTNGYIFNYKKYMMYSHLNFNNQIYIKLQKSFRL